MAVRAKATEHEKGRAMDRLYDLLSLQKSVEQEFGDKNYNIFVFGSYITTRYEEGRCDIDIAVYAEDFNLYKRLSVYLEEYFKLKGIDSDIFYIDMSVEAPVYCAALKSRVQFTDYYPQKLLEFEKRCRKKLDEDKARMVG